MVLFPVILFFGSLFYDKNWFVSPDTSWSSTPDANSRKEIYGDIRKDIGVILRKLCEQKNVEIIEAELCPDHIHMMVSIPPNMSVAQFVGYLKGKSALMIFDRHANLKYKYGNRHFWCRGYYVDTVGKNEKKIAEYIREQLQSDIMEDQISLKEFVDPFTGEKNK